MPEKSEGLQKKTSQLGGKCKCGQNAKVKFKNSGGITRKIPTLEMKSGLEIKKKKYFND